MDHAVSLAAREGHALKITFSPLRFQHVLIPEDWCFVVADSGVRVEKSGPAQETYNARRAECENAFSAVVEEVMSAGVAHTTPSSYPDLLRLVEREQLLALAENALDTALFRRLRHVVTEAGRVQEAVDRMRGADLAEFGTLMDASHGSLRADFLMSSSELDELVGIAREGGAAGARLTGAGLGGCIVALADRGTVRGVVDALVAEYFKPRGLLDRIERRVFIAAPSAGAGFAAVS
jgi:galactokinase